MSRCRLTRLTSPTSTSSSEVEDENVEEARMGTTTIPNKKEKRYEHYHYRD